MFTGIVTSTGRVVSFDDRRLEVSFESTGVELGESIAVNGVCLTVIAADSSSFVVETSEETLQRTNVSDLLPGASVNIERAMRADSRFGGHFVQGHVDGVIVVEERKQLEGSVLMLFSMPPSLSHLIVEKGSVTIDGVSLTVSSLFDSSFEVALIPHTLETTNLDQRQPGDRVNFEADVIGKYVERILHERGTT